MLATLHAFTGDMADAEAALAGALTDETPMATLDQREAWLARARVELAKSHPERALAIVDRLIAAATDDPQRDLPRLPQFALLRGRALAALDRPEEALAALASARDGVTARANIPLLWRIHLARFAISRSLGRRAEAATELAAAHEQAALYAGGIDDAALREAFLRRVAEHFPPLPRPSPRQAAKAAYGGLTRRERDVAALVAAGRTNREIGEALFMGERTAATHVGNILAKLDLKTRSQIAAWAQEHGLTEDGQADRRTGGQTP
jgi:DNA-binding CsgD family transcriptional regulator